MLEPKIPEPLDKTVIHFTSGYNSSICSPYAQTFITIPFSERCFQNDYYPSWFTTKVFYPFSSLSKLHMQGFALCSIKLLWHEERTEAACEICGSHGDDCVDYWLQTIPNQSYATLCVVILVTVSDTLSLAQLFCTTQQMWWFGFFRTLIRSKCMMIQVK